MALPEAAQAPIVSAARPSLNALLTLRRELDTVLSSAAGSTAHGGVDEAHLQHRQADLFDSDTRALQTLRRDRKNWWIC